MAEWNATTGAYETPEDPTKGVNSEPAYNYEYIWNDEAKEYQYVMTQRQGDK